MAIQVCSGVVVLKRTVQDSEKLIHALRNGTVPIQHANCILSGRKAEIDEFNRCLDLIKGETGQVKMILGDYGVGKTFLLNTYKQLALSQDYIVASFQINNGFRANKIDDLYYAIMHNLTIKQIPDKKISFDDIFNIWVHNIQHSPIPNQARYEINAVCTELSKFNQNYARAFLSFMRGRIQKNHEMTQVTSAWLSGEKNIPYALKEKYNLVGHVEKSNVIDFLRAFIKLATLLDYKGLIVFIDEVDMVLHERSDLRQTAYNNIKHLIDLATSGEMPRVFFVFSGTTRCVSDEEKGLKSNPALAQRLNLTTEKQENQNPVTLLRRLEEDDLIDLTHKVMHIYNHYRALPRSIDGDALYAKVVDELSSESYVTRQFVTTLIHQLDGEF